MCAGLIDLCFWAAAVYGLYALGWLRVTAWISPTTALPWPESAAVRLWQHPWSLYGLLQTVWAPMVVWQIVWGALLGGTPGAWMMGLRWVDRDGDAADGLRMVVRGAAFALWPLTLFLAPFTVWIARDGQGLHDQLAGVWAVDRWRRATVPVKVPRVNPNAPAPTVFRPDD
jgi:uncharacterized RDD family membrane protein YckC